MQRHFILSLVLGLACWGGGVAAAERVRVDIEGVSGDKLKNVQAFLGLYQQREHPRLSEVRIKRLHAQAEAEVREALKPFGYYRAEFSAELTPPGPGEEAWQARYKVQPGPPLPVAALELTLEGEGAEDAALRQLRGAFPLQAGQTLEHAKYETGKQTLLSLLQERGYFDAKLVRKQLLVDLEEYNARVVLQVDTGARYRLGAVEFEQDYYADEFLQRFVEFEVGEPYHAERLLKLQNRLIDSNYFASVEVRGQPEQAQDQRVPVRVVLVSRKPSRYSVSLGYGTDTGARGAVGWERYRINSRGHRFQTELRASQIRNDWVAQYIMPLGQPNEDYLAFNLQYQEESTDTSDTEAYSIGAARQHLRTLGWPFSAKRFTLREILGLSYRQERFSVGGRDGESKLLIPSLNWSYSRGDDPLYPRTGYGFNFKLQGAAKNLLSDVSLLQSQWQGTLIRPAGERARLLLRANLGLTWTDAFHDLPASLRFFGGGDNSVRGYAYNSLGPQDADGVVSGGKYLLAANLEYERVVKGNWSAAVFYDTGNAVNDFSEALVSGLGVGVRWRSPVGLVRLDLATPLNDDDKVIRLHIRVGPDL